MNPFSFEADCVSLTHIAMWGYSFAAKVKHRVMFLGHLQCHDLALSQCLRALMLFPTQG